jgi:predicted ATPase
MRSMQLFRDTQAVMPARESMWRDGAISMLIAFRAANVRSFREPFELSLLATRLAEEGVPRDVPWREDGHPISVLPVAGIFGANASGKSNVLQAMFEMRAFVLESFRQGSPGSSLPTNPFLLGGGDGEETPSTYSVDLVLNGVRHEYGFSVDSEQIVEEWARSYPRGRSVLLLRREGDEIQLGSRHRARGRATEEILRPNALFLSTAAATNHPDFLPLYEWFQRNLFYADVRTRGARQGITATLLEEEDRREQVLALLREADLGVTDVARREFEPEVKEKLEKMLDVIRGEDAEDEVPELKIDEFELRMKHRVGDGEVELNFGQESWGTLIWFGMIGLVLEALRQGTVLLADELESSLHPNLVTLLVDLFQSPHSNPRRAQLVFNSHEVTLMGDSAERPLGRDQIWLTEKEEDGSTRLYSLADLGPRREESVARRYLAGRYGATPIISRRRLEEIAEPTGDPQS